MWRPFSCIKRDSSVCSVLKDQRHWSNWSCSFTAQVHAHDCSEVCDESHVPSSAAEMALLKERQSFICAVTISEMSVSDFGSSIIHFCAVFSGQQHTVFTMADVSFGNISCSLLDARAADFVPANTSASLPFLGDLSELCWFHIDEDGACCSLQVEAVSVEVASGPLPPSVPVLMRSMLQMLQNVDVTATLLLQLDAADNRPTIQAVSDAPHDVGAKHSGTAEKVQFAGFLTHFSKFLFLLLLASFIIHFLCIIIISICHMMLFEQWTRCC